MKWNPALMRVCAYGRMGGFAGSAGGPRPAPRSPRPAPPRLPAAHWRGGARPRTPIFSRPVGPPRHPAALPPRPSLHASPARLRPANYSPRARARAPAARRIKKIKKMCGGFRRDTRAFVCTNALSRTCGMGFRGVFRRCSRARTRGAARARAAPVRVRPRAKPRQSASKRSCPLGELRRWEFGKFARRRSFFPIRGPLLRARARARGFADSRNETPPTATSRRDAT